MSKKMENCIVCGNKINRDSNIHSKKMRRGKDWVTCSKRCSKVYIKIYQYVRNRFHYKLKKLEELEKFGDEVKRKIRNVEKSQQISVSEIDELIVKYNIKYKSKSELPPNKLSSPLAN